MLARRVTARRGELLARAVTLTERGQVAAAADPRLRRYLLAVRLVAEALAKGKEPSAGCQPLSGVPCGYAW